MDTYLQADELYSCMKKVVSHLPVRSELMVGE